MKYWILILTPFLLLLSCSNVRINEEFEGDYVQLTAADGLQITGDLYAIDDGNAPLIILFHQAGFSRGEYRPIAPTLNKLGFNCLAIDQRSGKEVNEVVNETHNQAVKLKKGTDYIDALPDLEAAFSYAKKELSDNIIIWGSSYSASLVFYMGAKYPNEINGILAFSPGEYLKVDGQSIKSYASKVSCPVFITSAKNEHESWEEIYDAIAGEKYYYLPENKGFHGSRALWSSNEGHEDCWTEVEKFLMKLKK